MLPNRKRFLFLNPFIYKHKKSFEFIFILNVFLQKEELARQEKLKNLEKYGTKLGRSSKTLAAESSAGDQAEANLLKKKSAKSSLRPGNKKSFQASSFQHVVYF